MLWSTLNYSSLFNWKGYANLKHQLNKINLFVHKLMTQYLHYQLSQLACSQKNIVFVMHYALMRKCQLPFDMFVTPFC